MGKELQHIALGELSNVEGLPRNPIRDLLNVLSQPDITSFAGGIPDPGLFPRAELNAAYEKILFSGLKNINDPFQYGASQGYRPLREWIAEHMVDHGVKCTAENILITSGSQQGIDLISRLFLGPGTQVLVNNPSYLGALQIFRSLNATLWSLDNSPSNASVSPNLAYVVAENANPTGTSMTIEMRNALVDQAHNSVFPIIEDAAYTELTYNAPRSPSILSLDIRKSGSIDAAKTLYLGTFSKILAPGLRVGWVCGRRSLIDVLIRQKESADINTATLNQAVVIELVNKGLDTHLARLKDAYGARMNAMREALIQSMPSEVSFIQPKGGMFYWLRMPQELDTEALLPIALREAKLAFVPGRSFLVDPVSNNYMRLSFTLYPENRIYAGVAALGQLVEKAMKCSKSPPDASTSVTPVLERSKQFSGIK